MEARLPRCVEHRGRHLRGAAADLFGELRPDNDRGRAEASLHGPFSDRRVERERSTGPDERPVELLHTELEIADPVGRPRVVRLVGRHPAVDPHGQCLRVVRSGAARTTASRALRFVGRDAARSSARAVAGTSSATPSREGTMPMRSPYAANWASVGGLSTRCDSARKYASAAVPAKAIRVAPPFGRSSSAAMRRGRDAKLRDAPVKDTGPETATRARRAVGASISPVTGAGATATGRATGTPERSSRPSVRTMTSAAASRSSRAPATSGHRLYP